MDARSFTAPDGSTIFFSPPKNAEYDVLEVGEVERRIMAAAPGLEPPLSEALANAVMIWAPLPKDLAEDVNRAIFALESAASIVEAGMPDDRSFWNWREVKNDLFQTVVWLHQLRDRVYRTCDHKTLEPAPDAGEKLRMAMAMAASRGMPVQPWEGDPRRCVSCGSVWGPGSDQPARSVVPRVYSGKVSGRQRPGRTAFLYFATELLRAHGRSKLDAMQIAAKVIHLFWDDGKEPYDDLGLESAYDNGKASASANHLATVDDFMSIPLLREEATRRIVWVRIQR